MQRRHFIQVSATALALSLIESHFSWTKPKGIVAPLQPRIRSLRLLTTAPLDKMKQFYRDVLGLKIIRETGDELTIAGGVTPITFVKTNHATRPFYHFAFNIPENKIDSAFAWQRAKTPLVKPGIDSIVHFAHWNAHSIFFHDPAGNLLEYIARHDLGNAAEGDFSSKDILYASEIGLIVDDVNTTGKMLQSALQLTAYRPATPGFWPIGDEYGLLLMIEKGKAWANPPGMINKTDVFSTGVEIQAASPKKWNFPGYPYEIISI